MDGDAERWFVRVGEVECESQIVSVVVRIGCGGLRMYEMRVMGALKALSWGRVKMRRKKKRVCGARNQRGKLPNLPNL